MNDPTLTDLWIPLLPKEPLTGPVLVLAAHPDDEVIGCGGMLVWHGRQGHPVHILHATDGAAGDPDGKEGDIRAVRRREGEEALRRVGVLQGDSSNLEHWDHSDGSLPEHLGALVQGLRELFQRIRPATLYGFGFTDSHRDHRAMAWATAEAADALPQDCRCLLFGVNQVPTGGTLFDVTAEHEQKRHALGAYGSQLAYIDFAEASSWRDRANTVNIPDPSVGYCESFVDLPPGDLKAVRDRHMPLQRYLVERPRAGWSPAGDIALGGPHG